MSHKGVPVPLPEMILDSILCGNVRREDIIFSLSGILHIESETIVAQLAFMLESEDVVFNERSQSYFLNKDMCGLYEDIATAEASALDSMFVVDEDGDGSLFTNPNADANSVIRTFVRALADIEARAVGESYFKAVALRCQQARAYVLPFQQFLK